MKMATENERKILELLDVQSKLLQALTSNNSHSARPELLMDSLGNSICEFSYDPEHSITFGAWYSRHEDIFEVDGKDLDDSSKVRLLMRKLNPIAHEKYASYILPKNTRDVKFKDTVKNLKEMFGAAESLFNSRYRCLQTVKNPTEDFTTYAARVNKSCEDFKLSALTSDQFKCLVFVTGLQSSSDADIRTKLLSKLDEDAASDLSKLLSGVQKWFSLKKDAALIEQASSSSTSVNAVRTQQQKSKQQYQQPTQQQKQQNSLPKSPCWNCGEMHFSRDCGYKNHKCTKCNRVGHKEGYCSCFSSKSDTQNPAKADRNKSRRVKKKNFQQNKAVYVNCINHINRRKFVEVSIRTSEQGSSQPIRLQVDTGSDITMIDVHTWNKLGRPGTTLADSQAKSASLNSIEIIAEFPCEIQLNGEVKSCNVFVSKINALNILGTDLCEIFQLFDKPINEVCISRIIQPTTADRNATVASIKQRYAKLFQSDDSSVCSKMQVELHLKPDAVPVFRARRDVAYAVLPQIERELQRLQDRGWITPVDFSDWAAPIVVVRKSSGEVRLCGDYSSGLNDQLESHEYPIPTPEAIFTKIGDSEIFTHIDLADAFLQVEVTPESAKLLTINTHKGLFRPNRLAPGTKPAPGAFQQIADAVLAGIDGAAAYIDDFIIGGKDFDDHLRILHQVLQRLLEFNFRVKIEKCSFFVPQLKYLGHILDKNGLRPDPDKIERIKNMPAPSNITELRSFLGAVNYYGKFVKQMREIRSPLDNLLRDNVEFEWSKDCQQSFDKFKSILSSELLLTHYNPKLPIKVAADASNVGLGAYIAHTFPDGSEKVIMHAARSLAPPETRYSQIEKEAAALIFAVKKFHRMIFGRRFTLLTDHKPLKAIFGNKKGIPTHTANRLQRWALILMMYDFDIQYISTKEFGCVDVLSRLMDTKAELDEEVVIANIKFEKIFKTHLLNVIEVLPLNFEMVKSATGKSELLQSVISTMEAGWKSKNPPELAPFYSRRDGLAVIDGCLMFNDRIVIPFCLQKRVLKQLHRGHPGIERMKTIARSHVYWPKIDEDITSFVRQCHSCASAAKSPIKTTLQSWPVTTSPMERIHIDIAGPTDGFYYFIIVDSFSKWLDVFQISNITSSIIINKLNEFFSRYGDCEQLVSDNGTQFTSSHFQNFMQSRGIQHLRTAPFHPQSNGQAERFVDTLKRTLKKLKNEGGTSLDNLETFLQTYRSTPNRNVNDFKSPAEAFIGRKIKTSLDLLKPRKPISTTPNEKQNQQFDKHHGARNRQFIPGDKIYAKIYRNNKDHWVPGTVIERKGTVNYNVLVTDGDKTRLIRSHTNQIKLRYSDISQKQKSSILFGELLDLFSQKQTEVEVSEEIPSPVMNNNEETFHDSISDDSDFHGIPSSTTPEPSVRTRSSGRSVRAPVWTKDYDLS